MNTPETETSQEITSIDQLREKLSEVTPDEPSEEAIAQDNGAPAAEEKPAEEAIEEKPSEEAESVETEKPTEETAAGKPEAASTPVFTPDFKFRAGGKDFEVPEKFRALITDEASQKEIKEIFEKAYGLDDAKPRHERTKAENEYFKTKVIPAYQEQDKIIDELAGHIQRKDFDSYFEKLGIPEIEIQKWMHKKLSLTPEQRALYDQQREYQRQLQQTQVENQRLKEQTQATVTNFQQEAAQRQLAELDFTLKEGEFKDVAKTYDGTHGDGAFKNKVLNYAGYIYQTEKRDLSVKEAISEYVKFSQAATPAASKVIPAQSIPKEKPVLPTVKARPLSPAKQNPKSIKELRQKAKNLSGDENDD